MPPPSTTTTTTTDDTNSKLLEITNYDVLADVISNPLSKDENDVGLSLAAHSYHVGNNRLEVLCNIHNRAFSDHQAKGDEANSSAIVEKVMDIVQNQCVPKGRFLERNKQGVWRQVETDKVRLLVRQTLSNITQQNYSSKQSAQEIKKKQEDDAELKRRRRSSLLRRSVSSSMLPNFKDPGKEIEINFVDKKKTSRKGSIIKTDSSEDSPDGNARAKSPIPPVPEEKPRPVFGRSRSVELGGTGRSQRRFATTFERPPIIKDTLKMDVLLNTAKTALLPGTDLHGNNRLRVMVNIQTSAYKDADEDSKAKMATDLAGTIENFWGGRILSQIPSLRRKSDDDQYVKLDKKDSIQALKNLLSGKAAEKEEEITQGEITEGEETETNIKQGRRASLKAIQTIAATGSADSSILPSTLPTLPPDMQHLRSAAVKSLQKRKQRQGLNSRIRGLTADKAAIFQDGGASNTNNSNASVMSGATLSTMSAASHNITPPIPTTISGNLPNRNNNIVPPMHYRQTSSGASVASTVSHMSHNPPPGTVQRQGSISAMSTASASSNTSMSMNTMNAARTMANININAHMSPVVSANNRMMQHPGMQQRPMLGSELQIPTNIMTPMGQNPMQQYQQHVGTMPAVPEEMYGADPQQQQQQSLSANQYQFQQNPNYQNYGTGFMDGGQQQQQHYDEGAGNMPDRNSLLNSTGADGLPNFEQGEMELLIKGLEMGENQQQPDRDS